MTYESDIEKDLITKLTDLKYAYRPDIRDNDALKANFRTKFDALNHVRLTDADFNRLLDQIITPDVYAASKLLRQKTIFFAMTNLRSTIRLSTSRTGARTISR